MEKDLNTGSNNNQQEPSVRLWRRQGSNGTSVASLGQPMVWLAGGMLALCVVMIIALILLVVVRGMATFWPGPVTSYHTVNGQVVTGEVTRSGSYQPRSALIEALPAAYRERAENMLAENEGIAERVLVRTGNYEIDNNHFTWVSDYTIERIEKPEWFVVMERMTWGRFYGIPAAFYIDGEQIAGTPATVWQEYERYHDEIRKRWKQCRSLESEEVGNINHQQESARLDLRTFEMAAQQARIDHGVRSEEFRQAQTALERQQELYQQTDARLEEQYAEIRRQIAELNRENDRYQINMVTVDGQEKTMGLAEVVRAYPANQLSLFERIGVYLDRWQEFLLDDPREANSEGGVFPAIFGTVVMTLIMVVFVVPFGVLAALYLREYAKAGPLVSVIRIAVNNLAGVPSIVYGVFGLGFFCYLVGGTVDQLFFSEKLPNPTFGTGGILWASLTLALLTLPVVIVATEEALAAVPGSMREGSYASGASKWQTIQRIVLPRAMPGIMTGMILAMARGAGEVAPLMLVGAVKLAPELPIDSIAPFVHLERSFMHLGFHIYDLGFQSQNSEAAIPMVFTTTLLLILIITLLNLGAIWLRNRLRRKFVVSAV
jgi:phosphate transport system permease protein